MLIDWLIDWFAWTLTRPTNFNLLRQNIVFSYSERIPVSFSWLFHYFSFFFFYRNYFIIIILLYIFFYENYVYFFMFRNVPACSGMFHVPCSRFYRRPFQRELKWRHLEQERLRSSFKMAWGRTFCGVALKRRWRFGHDACTTKLRKVDRPLRCY